ncbi:pyruvoyl-dependent arginine decarboxylase [Candidatus Woesearchaeota archaeon]|nr:pyruvoyl-dependent arginine decarboxylase [Candidatus Woesearchaeota archaeon]
MTDGLVLKSEQKLITGNRIPKDFFITSGTGQSNITIHAGSYHLALKDARIERCNIICYSSILPAIANKIDFNPEDLTHGAVLESIMACANAKKGERATAAIIFGWLYSKTTGEKYGGLVCEYNGNKTEQEAIEELKASLAELYENGYSEEFDLREIETHSKSFVPEKNFGTALVSLCFVNYEHPVLI